MPINSFIYPGAKVTTVYEVANSCKFDRASSAYMDKSSGTSSSNDIYTLSFWMKRAGLEISDNILFSVYKDSNNRGKIGIGPADSGADRDHKLELYDWYGGSQNLSQIVDVHLMDPSAWYHICIRVDTTQSTANDRVRVYINGVDQASNITRTTTPDQNQNLGFQETTASNQWRIGSHNGGGDYFDGYLAEVCYCDGQSYAPTEFGEFDEDSPTIWKPKDVSGLTFGNNGFYLDFEDSSNLGNDANGGTDFAENGIVATDQATDTCTNNFCTMNPLDTNSNFTITEGNCKLAWSAAGTNFGVTKATMGVSAGKWYWEVKYTYGNAGQFGFFDVNDIDTTNSTDIFTAAGNSTFEGLAWRIDTSNNIKECANGQTDDTNVDFSSENILGIAFDADNGKIYAYQNGTEITNQNIGAGTSLMTALTVSDFYLPFISNGDGGSGTKTGTSEVNFGGCPAFSISSGNSDANGYGNFEYSVPSGYYSLCTKNLAEFG